MLTAPGMCPRRYSSRLRTSQRSAPRAAACSTKPVSTMTGSSAALAASAAAHNRTNAANFVAACVKGLRMIFFQGSFRQTLTAEDAEDAEDAEEKQKRRKTCGS